MNGYKLNLIVFSLFPLFILGAIIFIIYQYVFSNNREILNKIIEIVSEGVVYKNRIVKKIYLIIILAIANLVVVDPYWKDVHYYINGDAPTTQGTVNDVKIDKSRYGHNSIVIDNISYKYQGSKSHLHGLEGETVRISYLPNTKIISNIEKIYNLGDEIY